MKKETAIILLGDDDATDRELFSEALKITGYSYQLVEASDGQEIMDYLHSSSAKMPDFIFLDLNMPVMDGREILTFLKNSERYKPIPVLIMSTSNSVYDVKSCYQCGANLFLVKPDDFNELVNMLKSLLSLFKVYVATPEIQ